MRKFLVLIIPLLFVAMLFAASYRDYNIRQLLGDDPVSAVTTFTTDSIKSSLEYYKYPGTSDSFFVEVFVTSDSSDTVWTHEPVYIRNTGSDITVTGHIWDIATDDTIDVAVLWGAWTGPYYGWKWDTMFVASSTVNDTTFIYNVTESYSSYEVGGYWGIKIVERQNVQLGYGIQARSFEW